MSLIRKTAAKRGAAALAALALTGGLLSACGIPIGPGGPYGSGGQAAIPDPSQGLTGISVAQPFGGGAGPASSAVDRNGGTVP